VTVGYAAVRTLSRRRTRIHVAPDKTNFSFSFSIKHYLECFEENLAEGPARVLGVRTDAQHAVTAPVDLELQHLIFRREDQLHHLLIAGGVRHPQHLEHNVGQRLPVLARVDLNVSHDFVHVLLRPLDQLSACVQNGFAAVGAERFAFPSVFEVVLVLANHPDIRHVDSPVVVLDDRRLYELFRGSPLLAQICTPEYYGAHFGTQLLRHLVQFGAVVQRVLCDHVVQNGLDALVLEIAVGVGQTQNAVPNDFV